MSSLKVSAAAVGLTAMMSSGGMAAERDICNPDSYAEDLASELLQHDVADWPDEFLTTLGPDGIDAVSEELLDNWNIRTRNAERIIEDLGRDFKGNDPLDWKGAKEDAQEKAPMIEPVIDELRASGEISATSLDQAWVKATNVMATYSEEATEKFLKLAVAAPVPGPC